VMTRTIWHLQVATDSASIGKLLIVICWSWLLWPLLQLLVIMLFDEWVDCSNASCF
jgi:hypothetical protein